MNDRGIPQTAMGKRDEARNPECCHRPIQEESQNAA
jgi:hypothetical protein